MSTNKLINAVIALVEDRPAVARDILRSPEMTVSISEVQNRLSVAIGKREDAAALEALKDVLRQSLRVDPSVRAAKFKWTDQQREAFLDGISVVETIIDNAIDSLGPETQILSGSGAA